MTRQGQVSDKTRKRQGKNKEGGGYRRVRRGGGYGRGGGKGIVRDR